MVCPQNCEVDCMKEEEPQTNLAVTGVCPGLVQSCAAAINTCRQSKLVIVVFLIMAGSGPDGNSANRAARSTVSYKTTLVSESSCIGKTK